MTLLVMETKRLRLFMLLDTYRGRAGLNRLSFGHSAIQIKNFSHEAGYSPSPGVYSYVETAVIDHLYTVSPSSLSNDLTPGKASLVP